jgi:glycosyltransferase involved in cell wall biosynthesis
MKVLIFMSQFYQLGGAERLAVELAEELNTRGIHADILSMYRADLPGVAEAKRELLQRGIPNVHFLGMKIHPPIWSLAPAVMKLRCLIRENEYDIIETSLPSPTVIASLATRGTSIRHVAGLHGVFTRDRHGNSKALFWRLCVRYDRVIRYYAISEYVRRHWLDYSGTPPARTCTIYNAIPNDCFEALPQCEAIRKELRIPSGARIVLFVGRMLMRKGIDTILDSLGPILDAENLHLLYVGACDHPPEGFFSGETGLLERMRKEIAARGWSARVHFLGRRDDVARLMASSDLLVHPARIEGFGLVLPEAMAAGLPVVASNVEGIPEVLVQTESLMVPPDDPPALREAVLKTLHRSPEEAARAVRKGRQRAEDFRIGKRIDAMIKLFEDALARLP